MPGGTIAPEHQVALSASWVSEYYQEQDVRRRNQGWRYLLQPSAMVACLVVVGRVVLGPLALLLLFIETGYLTDATVFIKADRSFFSFTASDMSLAGGCTACLGSCKIGLLKYTMFNGTAITIAPTFNAFAALGQKESLYDFSPLSSEVLALAKSLDATGAKCQSGTSDWGSTYNAVTGTAQQIMDVILALNLSVAPQMTRELEVAIERGNECISTWNMIAIGRLFRYPTSTGSVNFGKVAAVDLNVFPDFTECRPVVTMNDSLVGRKLALATNGDDVVSVVPEILTLFPYIFTSSIPPVSRVAPATNTRYDAKTVVQPQLRAYYGGCRVREVNSIGVYVEAACELLKHWESYGLMIHSPDGIPLCSTRDVCVRNYYNSNWEWVNGLAPNIPGRTIIIANTFRNRYADTVGINIFPGIVVTQILLMGLLSLYQVMSHKRSVLLTQIWAYRCQNGRVQVAYFVQITYHLVYNSDLYLLGLATGTLTTESIANLTCCFFVFSYTFVNLIKARSGEQVLDRQFRLIWEVMQIVITVAVGGSLYSVQRTPILSIITENGEILRKGTSRGEKYCGLNDACVLFKVNMILVVAVLSVGLGIVAVIGSFAIRKLSPKAESATITVRRSLTNLQTIIRIAGTTRITAFIPQAAAPTLGEAPYTRSRVYGLTSFERNCIGGPFRKLFYDCDDIAYITYNDKRCTTVEALLLSGYLYYGEHIYQASSVMLLLVARMMPQRMLRTFNVLILRWYMDPEKGTLSHVLSCTWYRACEEEHGLAGAVPIA